MFNSRTPLPFTDADGKRCVRLPLAKAGQFAVLLAEDLAELQAKQVPLNWSFNLNGRRTHGSVKVAIPCDNVRNVARLITGAGKGEQVHYRDRNPMNLRRENLVVTVGGHATVDAAELLARQGELDSRAE